MQDTKLRLYAVRDKKSGNFVSNITNPGHKFWEKKGACENAVERYKQRYERSLRGRWSVPYNPKDLEIVELFCFEKTEALKVAELMLSPIEKIRDLTQEESAAIQIAISKISKPIIGKNGKPITIDDV